MIVRGGVTRECVERGGMDSISSRGRGSLGLGPCWPGWVTPAGPGHPGLRCDPHPLSPAPGSDMRVALLQDQRKGGRAAGPQLRCTW